MQASHIRITVAASELTLGATAYGGRQTPRDRWLGGLALSKATIVERSVRLVLLRCYNQWGVHPRRGGAHPYVLRR